MSDGQGGEGGGAGAAAIAAGGGGDGGQGGGAAPSWREALPEALRGEASFVNFADVGALAQGYLDTKRTATERLDSYKTDDGLKKFGEIVRPAAAADYEIPVPDGQDATMAEAFRAFAHETGLPPQWARGVAEFYNGKLAEAAAAAEQASQVEVDQLRQTMGAEKFNAGLQSVRQMLEISGVELPADDMAALDAKLGSGNLLKFMFNMAARVGDPAPVEGAGAAAGAGSGMGAMTPEQANARWNVAVQDANWRKQSLIAGTPEHKEAARLQNLIVQGRAKQA